MSTHDLYPIIHASTHARFWKYVCVRAHVECHGDPTLARRSLVTTGRQQQTRMPHASMRMSRDSLEHAVSCCFQPGVAMFHGIHLASKVGISFGINSTPDIALSRLLETDNVMEPKGGNVQDFSGLEDGFHGHCLTGPFQPFSFFLGHVWIVKIVQVSKVQHGVSKDGIYPRIDNSQSRTLIGRLQNIT